VQRRVDTPHLTERPTNRTDPKPDPAGYQLGSDAVSNSPRSPLRPATCRLIAPTTSAMATGSAESGALEERITQLYRLDMGFLALWVDHENAMTRVPPTLR
jgi:hypothetical protein